MATSFAQRITPSPWKPTAAMDPGPNDGHARFAIMERDPAGRVVAVHRGRTHGIGKEPQRFVRLLAGHGVEGDVHGGALVKHRSRVRRDASAPNLRQVHLIAMELIDHLRTHPFELAPGMLGENITTQGIDLLALPRGTRLQLGAEAVVEVTGLRNPCTQLDGLRPGLMAALIGRDEQGGLVRKAGVMAVVITGGELRPGDPIRVELPATPHEPLAPV